MVEVHEGMTAALRQGIEDAGLSTSRLSDGKLIGLLMHAALSPHHDWKPRLRCNGRGTVRMGIIRPRPWRDDYSSDEEQDDGPGYYKDWRDDYASADPPVAHIVAADDQKTIMSMGNVTHVTIVVPEVANLWHRVPRDKKEVEMEEHSRELVVAAWQGLNNVFPGVRIEAIKRWAML
jgi:hypothetical protein